MKKIILSVLTVILLIGAAAGISFEIYAKDIQKTAVISITAEEEGFRVELEEASDITGYQLQYSCSPKFNKADTYSLRTHNKYASPESLSGNQEYFVRARTYKTENGKTVFSSWSAPCTVITESKTELEKLTVSPETAKLDIGKTLQLKVSLSPENTSYKELKFLSSDSSVAEVTQDGLVRGLKEGKVKITVRALETDKKAVAEITVKKPYVAATGIKITNKKGITVETGKTLKMTAEVLPKDATEKAVIWSVSDESKASISADGTLKALRPTEFVNVTAEAKDGKFKASYTVKISKNKGYLTVSDLDRLNLSQINNLMIVAHPDDETFWGGGHILQDRYFIVVLTNGFHDERVADFNRVIKRYGNDRGLILSYPDTRKTLYTPSGAYNGYETDMWSTCLSGMEEDIKLLLNYKKWDTVVTHNPDGEYDKYHHQKVSELVTKCISDSKNSATPLYYFGHYYSQNRKITEERLDSKYLNIKEEIIKMYLPTAQGAYDAFRHMLPYENWILKQDW